MYVTEEGNECGSNNPNRTVWLGQCGLWTDNWDHLSSFNGLPVCPICKTPGFQGVFSEWKAELAKASDMADYVAVVMANPMVCPRTHKVRTWEQVYILLTPEYQQLIKTVDYRIVRSRIAGFMLNRDVPRNDDLKPLLDKLEPLRKRRYDK